MRDKFDQTLRSGDMVLVPFVDEIVRAKVIRPADPYDDWAVIKYITIGPGMVDERPCYILVKVPKLCWIDTIKGFNRETWCLYHAIR